MISDGDTRRKVQKMWNGVLQLQSKVHRALLGSVTLSNSFAIFMADAAHNLPFVQAYGVLNEVLHHTAHEMDLSYKGISLGRLMEATKGEVTWQDFDLVMEGKELRDGVAHRGDVVPRADCWKYIDAVEVELVAWRVVDPREE